MKKALIVGSGMSGCVPALLLRQKGWDVTIIESAGVTGGGVRTFFYGGHPYTYGPRHFLSPFPEAYEFLNKYVPLRDIKKINYTFVERDQTFYTYPIHADDVARMPEAERIKKELEARQTEAEATNLEEFYTCRVGPTLYDKFVKHYNKKAWMVESNTEMNFGFEATVKARPLETGDRYEFRDWFNCYPVAHDGYNKFFDIALEGCTVRLNTKITKFDLDAPAVWIGNERIASDILISTISPDTLMEYQYGELGYVGREFHKIVLPVEYTLPPEVYFVYYPNDTEAHTRVVEYKKFTLHKAASTLIGLEIPSKRNRLYPTMIKSDVEKAQKYFDALPGHVYSMGRMGTYRYIDIDDIIVQSLKWIESV